MSKYECTECGFCFDEPDIIEEQHGCDTPPYEKIGVCPRCHGYFEEVYECKICGEHFTDDELSGGVCDACIYEEVNLDRCFKFGAECEESVPINGFIASVLDPDQINYILMQKIKEAAEIIPIDITEFIDSDKSWIAEKLLEKKEKENF